MTAEPGTCELHKLEGEALVHALFDGLGRPVGLGTCKGCVTRARQYAERRLVEATARVRFLSRAAGMGAPQ